MNLVCNMLLLLIYLLMLIGIEGLYNFSYVDINSDRVDYDVL